MKYTYRSEVVGNGVVKYRINFEGLALTHRDVHRLWIESAEFTQFYVGLMLKADFTGFCWETPAVTLQTLDNEHEFVIVRSDIHSTIKQNWRPFAEQFNKNGLAVSFLNLGKNGTMVAPTPDHSYDGGSLASFLKTASSERIEVLWKLVGREISSKVSSSPIWLSTAGLGVSWLHIRLDSRPKYFRYLPYK